MIGRFKTQYTIQRILNMFVVRERYYFITYQGVRRDNDKSISIWHDVTDKSPMEFRESLIDDEYNAQIMERKSYYLDFIILNTERIKKKEYKEWVGYF